MRRAPRAHWLALVGVVVALLAAAFLAPRWIAPPDLDEARRLADRPPAPVGLSGLDAYRRGLDAYVADRFPPRAHLIGALNFLRLKLGVSGSSRVVVGRDGWLFYDNGSHLGAARGDPALTRPDMRAWLAGLAGRSEWLKSRGVAYLYVAAPDKEAVYPQYAPAWFRLNPDRPAILLPKLAALSGAGEALYLGPAMAQPSRWGLRTYGKTDTHWTGLGAYEGYAAIMRRLQHMGLTDGPRPLEAFQEVRTDDPAKPRNLALMLGVASFVPIDYPELDDPPAEQALKTEWLSPVQDWTKPRVVDTGQAGKPVLLMTMDSFSNALLPFLYGHFSRIILAHNQDGAWRQDLIERYQPNIVLLEVTENGLPMLMSPAPPASPEALARIDAVLGQPLPRAPRPARPAGPAPPLRGTPGDDRLEGTDRDDDIRGLAGNDTINGRGGNDHLRGGKGNDLINGGDGDDWISGDLGDDTLTGGRGADIFHSFAGAGLDVVTDFSVAEGDRVELDAGTAYVVRQQGADTVIQMRGATVVLKGVKASTLPRGAIYLR